MANISPQHTGLHQSKKTYHLFLDRIQKVKNVFHIKAIVSVAAHLSKSEWAKGGVTEIFLMPRPLKSEKASLLVNTCPFLFTFYKQSNSETISITIEIDLKR